MARPLSKCFRHAVSRRNSQSLRNLINSTRVCAGCLEVSRSTLSLPGTVDQTRSFFSVPNLPFSGSGNKRKEYAEKRLLGYSMEQMYDIVAEVDKYNQFVPWCKQSTITNSRPGCIDCKLEIGFPPLAERYTSVVTLERPNLVRVAFEFRSQLYSQVSHAFFDEVVRQMVNAFLKRAKRLHGPSSIKPQKPKILVFNS